jgi:DNA polymerase-2
MKAFIVDADYQNIDGKIQIMLFGRQEDGKSFGSIHNFKPYFFIKEKDGKKSSKLLKKYEVDKTNLTNFAEEKVIKISHESPTELNKLIQFLHKANLDTYEADVKPVMRFIIDNNLLSTIEINSDSIQSDKVDAFYQNPEIKPAIFKPKLKMISIDTESSSSGDLFCIGLYSKDYKKNFIVSEKKLQNAVSCKDERECLNKLIEEIQKIDPDIITGWNLIDFDFVYLKSLFEKNKIPFSIGRTNSQTKLRIEDNYFRSSKAIVQGRMILDALSLIKDPFIQEAPKIKHAEFESFTLESVSNKILNDGKLIKGKERQDEISELYKTNQEKLVEYNLKDAELAYRIVEKTEMIPLLIERSQLTGLQFDKLTASIQAFDSLYIREARKRNLVSPSTVYGLKEEKIKGAYVKLPDPGIYENIIILDFKSLYPSILTTFNIDPASHLSKPEKEAIKSPIGEYFRNNEGILPDIIKTLHNAREKAKSEKRELSNHAIKTIMNSFWGVLASPNCRYFNYNMASSITAFAREIIQDAAKEIENHFKKKVLYSDTDSVFVISEENKLEAEILGKKIEEHINNYFKQKVKNQFKRESYLELQFQKLYLNMMFPKVRIKNEEEQVGAKKRYAGLIEKSGKEELEITGLEAVRGDWTEAAQDFQKELLIKIFHKEPIEPFIRDYVNKINSGKLDNKLIYRKSIRKELEEYTKTTPPHVKAARLLDSLESNIIQYFITTEGPEPIQKLKHKLDYSHYIDKQIKPIANQILSLLNKNFEDIIKGSKQKTLF